MDIVGIDLSLGELGRWPWYCFGCAEHFLHILEVLPGSKKEER